MPNLALQLFWQSMVIFFSTRLFVSKLVARFGDGTRYRFVQIEYKPDAPSR